MSRRACAFLASVVTLAALLASGCGVSMPESGPVVGTAVGGSRGDDGTVNINPRRPSKDASPEDIVRGFIEAMTATPAIKTSVAREFLTQDAQSAWKPTGTVIYSGALTTTRVGGSVVARLGDAARTDARGAWLGALSEEASTVAFPMEEEAGQWRISDPPDWLIVPQSWFEQRFRQVSLYFFDPTGSVLIPEPVFVPRGRQFASTLVNGLLAGPTPELAADELNLLPPNLRSLVSVPVSEDGVAQVDLTSDSTDDVVPATSETELLVSQLAWTLRQDPTIKRFGVTIGGRPVQLPNGETEFDIDHGEEYAPYVAGAGTLLYGLLDGRLVSGRPGDLQSVPGPFGQADYGLRTIAPDLLLNQAAGVTATGDTLLIGPVKDTGDPVVPLLTGGEDLLDPAWDFSGRLWEVDRRATGAVVQYLQGDRMRPLDVPGISGADVKDFLVSRDGSRLVAVLRTDADNDLIMVSRILTKGDGRVDRALPAVSIAAPDDGRIRDIAWRSPTSLIVLYPVLPSLFQIRPAAVDGAPTGVDAFSIPIDKEVVGLIGTPAPELSIYAFSSGSLTDLSGPRSSAVDVDDRVTSLGYVG
jgi:lipoprotein LpqB-like beta-propeller protein/sporulation and spore germination protein